MAESSQSQPPEYPSPSSPGDRPSSPRSPNSISADNAPIESPSTPSRPRGSTGGSSTTQRLRAASIKFLDSDVPAGAWAASSTAASKAPTLSEIRRGSYSPQAWTPFGQQAEQRRRGSAARENSSSEDGTGPWQRLNRTDSNQDGSSGGRTPQMPTLSGSEPFPALPEEDARHESEKAREAHAQTTKKSHHGHDGQDDHHATTDANGVVHWQNGYTPPPHLPWTTSTLIGLKAFWKWFITPAGFLITVYCLNIVAWGGMLFLLLVNAAPAMCRPTCNDLYSPRRIWLEIDSQILNALFCVTGLGLIPWRFRDLYWLLLYRLQHKEEGVRRLAGIHRSWFRLKGSDKLDVPTTNGNGVTGDKADENNPAIPIPASKAPDPPLTGVRAPPTSTWKLDYVIWCNVWNTFFQICLCGFMWGMNRFNRPSWSTGLFIALACIIAALGGLMMFVEGKKVKRVEGVPPEVHDTIRDVEKELVPHGRTGPDRPASGPTPNGISEKAPAQSIAPA